MKNVELKMYKKKGPNEEQDFQLRVDDVTEDQGTALIVNMFKAFGVEDPMHIVRLEAMTGLSEVACGCAVGEAVQAEESAAQGIQPAQYHPHAAPLKPFPQPAQRGPVERVTPEGSRMIDDIVISKSEDLQAKQQHELAQAKQEISRQLPIIGASERSTYSIADDPKNAKLLEAAKTIAEKTPAAQKVIDERPAHIVTGVKVIDDNGTPVQTFRVRCACPSCGWVGNRYIRRDNTWAKCYNCNLRLAVIPATNQPMVPDAYNNFFVASEEYIDV